MNTFAYTFLILGSPAYDSVRPLSYPDADVFLLCFSVADPASLFRAKSKWINEIRAHASRTTPVVLCATQGDLREDAATALAMSRTGRSLVSQEQALAICCEIEAVNYVETTSAAIGGPDAREALELCALAAIKDGGGLLVKTPSSSSKASSAARLNSSFGSHHSSTASTSEHRRRSSHSGASSLKKSTLNISFSGSEEAAAAPVNAGSPILEDDVFPPASRPHPPPPPPLSPRLQHEQQHHHHPQQRRKSQHFRSSMSCLSAAGNGMPTSSNNNTANNLKVLSTSRVEFVIEDPPLHTSTVLKTPLPPQQQQPAQIRPSCLLSRRTSFRSQRAPQQPPPMPIPVASPKSPLGGGCSDVVVVKSPLPPPPPLPPSEVLLDLNAKSAAGGKQVHHQAPGAATKAVLFESLKSHTSTASQGSTGSKTSTGSSEISTSSLSSAAKIAAGAVPPPTMVAPPPTASKHIMDPSVPDTEDPELLSQLQFVSPKQGVFRPVGPAASNAGGGAGKKNKQNCVVS